MIIYGKAKDKNKLIRKRLINAGKRNPLKNAGKGNPLK